MAVTGAINQPDGQADRLYIPILKIDNELLSA